MKYRESVIIKDTIGIVIALLLLTTLALNAGCSAGGSKIKLEGVSLGAITTEGKPIQGLPSDKVNILLQVPAREITVRYTTNSTVLTLNESGATLEITPDGIIIKGLKPEQIKVEWGGGK